MYNINIRDKLDFLMVTYEVTKMGNVAHIPSVLMCHCYIDITQFTYDHCDFTCTYVLSSSEEVLPLTFKKCRRCVVNFF